MQNRKFESLIILLGMLFTGSLTAQQGYQVGDTAANFDLPAVDGSRVSLDSHPNAKGALVIFSCNTCPYVVAYEDRMIALHEQFAPQGYPVIAINPNDATQSPGDSFDKMKERANSKKFPFKYAYDESQEVTRKYGATNTPQVYLVQKDGGEYKVRYIGAIDNSYQDASAVSKKYVENAVGALISDQKVSEDRTKAIGCTIKWKKSS